MSHCATDAGERRRRQRQAAHERRYRRAVRLRRALVRHLGGRCGECGTRRRLEVDHQDGRTWRLELVPSHKRAERYWQELRAGVRLRVLCRSCNARHQPPRSPGGDA